MRIVGRLHATRPAWFAIGSAIAGYGCASIWGFQDAKDLADGATVPSDGSVADGFTSTSCVCVPSAPIGWRGPYALLHVDGGAPSSCPDPYGIVEYDGGTIAAAGAPACQCLAAPRRVSDAADSFPRITRTLCAISHRATGRLGARGAAWQRPPVRNQFTSPCPQESLSAGSVHLWRPWWTPRRLSGLPR